MADVLENLLEEIAHNHRDILAASLYSWTVAVRLFQKADHEFSDRLPNHEENRNHQRILDA
jgi:hypothetical protein